MASAGGRVLPRSVGISSAPGVFDYARVLSPPLSSETRSYDDDLGKGA